jgi:hypothetical protein
LTTTDVDAISKQLWRFEIPTGVAAYRIINKYYKKQLTVIFEANRRKPALTENSSIFWSFPSSTTTGYKYVKIINEPQEGTQGEIFLSQQTLSNNYAYRMVTEANRVTNNELFRCVLNEIPVVSSDNGTIWLNIRNPRTNKYLTDAVATAPNMNFTLEAQNNSQSQQWKMIAKENGNVEFVNRATGNIIATTTNLNKYYYVDYTTNEDESAGWNYAPVSNTTNQYEIFSTADDGAVSYWNATTNGQAAEVYAAGNVANSTYAWIFTWTEEIKTSINTTTFPDNIRVYSANKRIYVEGCNEYRITAISGISVRKDIELPRGVYLVTVKGKTTKILVK